MINKKGGRIRTYGRPAPDLLGWVAGLAPLVASVPETDALRYPARNLVSPIPLLVMPLPIAGNPRPAAPDLIRTIILMTKQGPAYLLTSRAIVPRSRPATCWEAGRLSVKTKRWLFFLGLSNQRMPIPPLMTPSRESLNLPMWIERKLGMDIDPSAYPECWK
ncbi:hypothetical protein TIFTF001_046176 [Ficus carica]|uniref:Uncharacterized protein n=1 Tax=Ficus carica TaxID=3494 RepID=A0AA87ZIQ2_FICCA|nr:hypothetical protein TIFTF001_046176 [Ficus carica]